MQQDQDILDLEEQQKLYQMEQDAIVLNESIDFPDYTKSNSHYAPYLDESDIQTLKDIIKSQATPKESTVAPKFTVEYFLKSLATSFIGIVNDLLKFNGNLEDLGEIFSKDDRLVLIGLVLVFTLIVMLMNAKNGQVA